MAFIILLICLIFLALLLLLCGDVEINPGPKSSTENDSIEIVDSHSLLAGCNMEGYLKKLIPLPSQVSGDVDCTRIIMSKNINSCVK